MDSRKVLFLDRDGTINVDKNYVYRIEDFEWVPGIFDLCRAARKNGFELVVVTNQSGIARGYYTESEYQTLTSHMRASMVRNGTPLLDVLHCPCLDGFDRKPEPGMFLQARDRWKIDMGRSISLGDKERDVEAAIRAGVGYNVLLSSASPRSRADRVIADLHGMIPLLATDSPTSLNHEYSSH